MAELQKAETKNKGFLGWIERVGNKMPHPFKMFMQLTGIVLVLSFVLGMLKVSAVHPNGQTITVFNFISWGGLSLFAYNFISTWQNFTVLGIVFLFTIATSLCDRTGLFAVAVKLGLSRAKGNLVVVIFAFVGVFLTNLTGDVAFILVPSIGAVVFLGIGRHPLAGAFLGYATAAAGMSLTIIPPGFHMILTPITAGAAKILVPEYTQDLLAGYYIEAAGGVVCAVVASLVTITVIEPRLGKYVPQEGIDTSGAEVTDEEKRGVRNAGIAALIWIAAAFLISIPFQKYLASLPPDSPVAPLPAKIAQRMILQYLGFFFLTLFAVAGIVYGYSVKKIRSIADAAKIMEEGAKMMASFLVLVIVISQFLYIFGQTNLATVLAINGGAFLKSINAPPAVIAVLFIILTAFINIFMGSAVTKWLLFAPVFVPMLMQLNLSPIFTHVLYCLGDNSSNNLTPLLPYFAILLATVQKYDKKAGMGTLFSAMLPYSGAFLVAYCLLAVIWMALGLPLGPGGSVFM